MRRPRSETRDEAARTLVRGSQVPVPAGRRCSRCQKTIKPEDDNGSEPPFCSSDCHEAARVECSIERLRAQVLERDRGVCASCGLDCLSLRAELDALKAARMPGHIGWFTRDQKWQARVFQLTRLGFDKHAVESGSALWEADHDPPRVKGGKNTLSGVKTKCLACHKQATASLAKGRAASRRPGGRRA